MFCIINTDEKKLNPTFNPNELLFSHSTLDLISQKTLTNQKKKPIYYKNHLFLNLTSSATLFNISTINNDEIKNVLFHLKTCNESSELTRLNNEIDRFLKRNKSKKIKIWITFSHKQLNSKPNIDLEQLSKIFDKVNKHTKSVPSIINYNKLFKLPDFSSWKIISCNNFLIDANFELEIDLALKGAQIEKIPSGCKKRLTLKEKIKLSHNLNIEIFTLKEHPENAIYSDIVSNIKKANDESFAIQYLNSFNI